MLVDRAADEDELMLLALDAGAEDIVDEGDTWRVVTPPAGPARGPRRARGGAASPSSRPTSRWSPPTSSRSTTPATAKQVLGLIDALEDHDDVQDVYANFDIPDDILEAVTA